MTGDGEIRLLTERPQQASSQRGAALEPASPSLYPGYRTRKSAFVGESCGRRCTTAENNSAGDEAGRALRLGCP